MLKTSSRRPFAAVLACAGALMLSACPIPARHMAQVTPTLIGIIQRDDGSPVADALVAATAKEADLSCREAQARITTDASGRFQLPEIRVQKRIFWFTMFERFGMTWYWLCASATGSSDSTSIRRTIIRGHVSGDSVACLEWQRDTDRRLTCTSSRAPRILTGGQWTHGPMRGWYRVIVADDEPWGHEARVFVQWLDSSSAGDRAVTVRAQAELATGPPVKSAPVPTLTRLENRWYVTVVSAQQTKWGNDRDLRFELGPPGEVRQVSLP